MKQEDLAEAEDLIKRLNTLLCAEVVMGSNVELSINLFISSVGSGSFKMEVAKSTANNIVKNTIEALYMRAKSIGLKLDIANRAAYAFERITGDWQINNRFREQISHVDTEEDLIKIHPTLKRTSYDGKTSQSPSDRIATKGRLNPRPASGVGKEDQ